MVKIVNGRIGSKGNNIVHWCNFFNYPKTYLLTNCFDLQNSEIEMSSGLQF